MAIFSITKLFEEVPLSWSQLTHQKTRLLIALSGISFANILIFMQLGFRATMFDGVTRVPENLDGDLFLVNSKTQYLGNESFAKTQLYRAEAVKGVASVKPFYYTIAPWLNPTTQKSSSITVIAFNPAQPVLNLPEVNRQISLIEQPDTILYDSKSLASLGSVSEPFKAGKTIKTKVGDREMQVGGLFTLGSSLFKRGHIVTSDVNYLRIFGADSAQQIQAGLIKLEPGTDPQRIIATLKTILPNEIQVLDRKGFIALENKYWSKEPAGVIFNFGTIMGFIVGVVIVYQVLYSDVNDHLPEYATLKAIGYSDISLLGIVFQEAAILAIFGFLPGCLCSTALYGVLGNLTRIAVVMRFDVALQVFILTLIMCLLSAAIAVRKLQSADPADVF